ncbi:hypothetical protein BC938DRAFT_477870, partial [Jimgerdemannia flammicorona]
ASAKRPKVSHRPPSVALSAPSPTSSPPSEPTTPAASTSASVTSKRVSPAPAILETKKREALGTGMVKEKLTQDAAMGNSGMGAGTDVSESESELPALLPQGKYCTRTCGMIVAHARLTQSEAKRRAILGESNYHGHARSGLVSAADMDDRKRLIQVREQQGKVRRAIELIERRTRFLKKVVRRAMVMRAGGENGVPVTVSPQKTTKSKGKGKKGAGGEEDGALCGFDFRLVWDDGKWRDGDENFDGSDDDLSDVDMSEDGKKSGRVCRDPKKKCGKHVGWQKLKMLEVEQEKGIQ